MLPTGVMTVDNCINRGVDDLNDYPSA